MFTVSVSLGEFVQDDSHFSGDFVDAGAGDRYFTINQSKRCLLSISYPAFEIILLHKPDQNKLESGSEILMSLETVFFYD